MHNHCVSLTILISVRPDGVEAKNNSLFFILVPCRGICHVMLCETWCETSDLFIALCYQYIAALYENWLGCYKLCTGLSFESTYPKTYTPELWVLIPRVFKSKHDICT